MRNYLLKICYKLLELLDTSCFQLPGQKGPFFIALVKGSISQSSSLEHIDTFRSVSNSSSSSKKKVRYW